MRILNNILLVLTLVAGMAGWAAQGQQPSLDQAIDRIIQRENQEAQMLRQYTPVIETYVQDMRPDTNSGVAPVTDHYFLGKAILSEGTVQQSSEPKKDRKWLLKRNSEVKLGGLSGVFPKESVLDGFLQMIYVDPKGFDRAHYHLDYVRREFLGGVRCLVFDVTPAEKAGTDRFLGRIWAEDQGYTIVRFNGVIAERPKGYRLHFDSWRVNVSPGMWMPAYIYSAESQEKDLLWNHVRFRAETLLWGYNKHAADQDRSADESLRARQRETEANAIDKLQTSGLLAPPGELDKVLATVVNNLEVSNDLDIEPDVQCHVLLTSTLESFTIGRSIVVSRGLLDVLPDEGSLAMILAHELGHVLAGHSLGDQFAFSDWAIFPPGEGFNHWDFPIDAHEEEVANKKALALLEKSPYKTKLHTAGMFLQLLNSQANALPKLISPHVESRAALANQLLNEAPAPHPASSKKEEQVAALPLGSRVKLDPWTDQVELMKTQPVGLLEGQERQPFQIGPYMPDLFSRSGAGKVDPVASRAKAKPKH
jgi:hypothetical protein